jgi:hypothetical protein
MRGGVAQPGAAELDRGLRDPAPEWPDRRRDPQFDPGLRMPSDEVIDQDPFRRPTGLSQTQ